MTTEKRNSDKNRDKQQQHSDVNREEDGEIKKTQDSGKEPNIKADVHVEKDNDDDTRHVKAEIDVEDEEADGEVHARVSISGITEDDDVDTDVDVSGGKGDEPAEIAADIKVKPGKKVPAKEVDQTKYGAEQNRTEETGEKENEPDRKESEAGENVQQKPEATEEKKSARDDEASPEEKRRRKEEEDKVERQRAKQRQQSQKKRAEKTQKQQQEEQKQGDTTHAEYEQEDINTTLAELNTDTDQGLSDDDAERRREKYGANEIEEEKESFIVKLLKHFWGPIPWMIEIAALLAAVAGRWEDFAVIFVMLLINGGVGFWHDKKASDAIEALKKTLAPKADVIRDGSRRTIDAKKLVPGDIVILSMGDVVPADAKLLHDETLNIDESSLTGESLPVSKEGGMVAYSGTTVKRGEAKAVVTATGRDTRFAQTVELVESAEQRSHFQKAVLRIGYFLIGITIALVVGVVLYSVFALNDPWLQVMLFALALTVAGIPQALPAVLSVTMSVGAGRLAKMKAIVSRLPAMEEMAGLEVLCADKTGTLTKNELELQEPASIEAKENDDIILLSALTAKREAGDPIDEAILGALEDKSELDQYEVIEFRPFDPTSKRAEADVKRNGDSFTVAKGAPQVLLDLVDADEDLRKQVSEKVDDLGESGYRSLGVAKKEGDSWRYIAILPLLDPPRPDSADVIEEAQDHGIDIRMVTGDHTAIGKQVAGQVGLGTELEPASSLFSESGEFTEEDRDRALDLDGFAEVTPEHKFNIIKAFQAGGKIVGMTGDGVNDAPALQQADVGIAVADATDAARSASDLILTEQGLGVITHAVEEARRIFERMTSYATFRITETMRVLLFVSLSIVFFGFDPVTPIMIVLLAILNDIPIMAIAWDNVRTAKNPVRWNMKRVLTIASVMSVAGVIESFSLLWFVNNYLDLPHAQVQTIMFLKLLVAGHMTIFLTRNDRWILSKPLPNLWLFLALEGTQVVGTLFAVFGVLVHPIAWWQAGVVWGYALIWLLLLNAIKIVTYKLIE